MINEQKMDRLLLELGHDDFNRGTAYLREAVKMYEPGMGITKEVYPTVAKRHGSTASRVERCMRHSIEKAWSRGNQEARMKYFGFSYSPELGRPTVGEYIARVARLCREDLEL